MKPSATPLDALAPSSDHDTIQVRVTRIWEAINKRNITTLHTNIILLDEKNNHMLGIIRNNQKQIYLPTLKEGEVYAISNFKVVPGPKQYKPVDTDYSINFYYKTRIGKGVDSAIIPHHKFELKGFEDIQHLVGNVELLIDVMGMVKSYGTPETRTNGSKKIYGHGKELWNTGNKGQRLQKIGCTTKQCREQQLADVPSLSSTDATRCYVNIDYAPLNALKESLTKAGYGKQEEPPAPTMEQFLTPTGGTVQELPISVILETVIPPGTQVVRCICWAKIVNVLAGNGWYYNCCPTCARALRDLIGKFYYLSCDEKTPTLAQRFRIVVAVEDNSGSTTVTLFNKEAEQIVGIPLDKILAEKAEKVEKEQEAQIAPVLRNIIGKLCAFQLKITPYNIIQGCEEYTVTRVSEVHAVVPAINILPASASVETPNNPTANKKQKIA